MLLTDGVIEKVNQNGEMYGFERWEEALAELDVTNKPAMMIQDIQYRLSMYSNHPKVHSQNYMDDDWTIVFVQRARDGEDWNG